MTTSIIDLKELESILDEIDANEKKQNSQLNNDEKSTDMDFIMKRNKFLERKIRELRQIHQKQKTENSILPTEIAIEVGKCINLGDVQTLKKMIEQGIININSKITVRKGLYFGTCHIHQIADTNMSLLQYASAYGQYAICKLLINLGASDDFDACIVESENQNNVHISVLLRTEKMVGSNTNEVNDICNKINKQNGIIMNLLTIMQQEKDFKMIMETLEKTLLTQIENENGFLDDVLNMLYLYYQNIENKSFKDSKIWKVIIDKCKHIILNKNIKNWYWLTEYIMKSMILYRNNGMKENKKNLLFYDLLDIVESGFATKVNEKLQKPFIEIEQKSNDKWNELKNYKLSNIDDNKQCRQDEVINGIKADYTYEELTEFVAPSAVFNPYHHYDVNEYLSKLILVAHTIDERFHESIRNIFEIDINTNVSEMDRFKGLLSYQRGPIKLLGRCRAKALTDYAGKKFPVSAHVLDINRGALVFKDITSLLDGLKLFENKINYYQSGNIIQIVRVKNGFKTFDAKTNPIYADIKLNVLIKSSKGICLIGELQFLLYSMLKFKTSVHSFYSIIRKTEFVDELKKILVQKLDNNIQLRQSAAMLDYKGLADMIVTHNFTSDSLLKRFGDDKKNILIPILRGCSFKNRIKSVKKCMNLIINFTTPSFLAESLKCGQWGNIDGGSAVFHSYASTEIFSMLLGIKEVAKLFEKENVKVEVLKLTLYGLDLFAFKESVKALKINEKEWISFMEKDTDGFYSYAHYSEHHFPEMAHFIYSTISREKAMNHLSQSRMFEIIEKDYSNWFRKILQLFSKEQRLKVWGKTRLFQKLIECDFETAKYFIQVCDDTLIDNVANKFDFEYAMELTKKWKNEEKVEFMIEWMVKFLSFLNEEGKRNVVCKYKGVNDDTLLHFAIKLKRLDLAKCIIDNLEENKDKSVVFERKDEDGLTVLDCATNMKFDEAIDWIQQQMKQL